MQFFRFMLLLPSLTGALISYLIFHGIYYVPFRSEDLWWHLASGRYLSENWSVLSVNFFSHTNPAQSWIAHSWLFEWILYQIYSLLSWPGIIMFASTLKAFTLVVLLLFCRSKKAPFFLQIPVILYLGFLLYVNHSIRPILVGNLLLLLLLYFLECKDLKNPKVRFLWLLLFMLWANLHGSYFIGLGVILLYLINSRFFERQNSQQLLVLLLIASLASLINPYTWRLFVHSIRYLLASFLTSNSYLQLIGEWQSPLSTPGIFNLYLLASFSPLIFSLPLLNLRGNSKYYLLYLIGVLAATGSNRNIALLAIFSLPLLIQAFSEGTGNLLLRHPELAQWRFPFQKTLKRIYSDAIKLEKSSSAIALICGCLLACSFSLADAEERLKRAPAFSYPGTLIEYLKAHPLDGNLFHHIDWGGALIWEFSGSIPVFLDTRNDCYTAQIFEDYKTIFYARSGWQELLQVYEIRYLALPLDSALVHEIEPAKVLFKDASFVLLEI